jgi:hypothetical protein
MSKNLARRNPDFAMRASGARAAVPDSGGSAPHSSARFDDGEAFLHDPHGGPARTREVLAEKLAEGFVSSATNAQGLIDDAREVTLLDELDGLSVDVRPSAQLWDAEDAAGTPLDVVPINSRA